MACNLGVAASLFRIGERLEGFEFLARNAPSLEIVGPAMR